MWLSSIFSSGATKNYGFVSSYCHQFLAETTTKRFMSKYLSKAATKRLPLTTKKAGKGYYKGKGGTTEGHFGKGGRFVRDKTKMLELVVPNLEGFKVRTYQS